MLRGRSLSAAVLVFLVNLAAQSAATTQAPVTRGRDEAVNDAALRTRAGLLPSDTLLFNGWGITPAGRHVPLSSDMPLKMVVSPDKRSLVAVGGFFQESGVTLVSIETREVTQFLPLKRCWNGIAFSPDGKRLFVSGSDSGTIHVFAYADGRATYVSSAAPIGEITKPGPDVQVYLTGIAGHPRTGRVYVCNEAAHEVWVLHPETLALESRIPTGQHPHSCVLGGDQQHLWTPRMAPTTWMPTARSALSSARMQSAVMWTAGSTRPRACCGRWN